MPDRARPGFLWIRRAHRVAPLANSSIRFQNHGKNLSRTHEFRKFTEKGAFPVNIVKSTCLFFCQPHGLDRNDLEARSMDTCKDFPLLPTPNGVRLDDCKCAFNRHKILLNPYTLLLFHSY